MFKNFNFQLSVFLSHPIPISNFLDYNNNFHYYQYYYYYYYYYYFIISGGGSSSRIVVIVVVLFGCLWFAVLT